MFWVGMLGALLFAICGLPLAIDCYKKGYSTENIQFIWIWFIGEILSTVYVISEIGFNIPLLLNYFCSIILIGIVLRYEYFPRKGGEHDKAKSSKGSDN